MRRTSPRTLGISLLDGLEPLTEAVRQKQLILFVGGGASQNLGLPGFIKEDDAIE